MGFCGKMYIETKLKHCFVLYFLKMLYCIIDKEINNMNQVKIGKFIAEKRKEKN